MNGESVLEGDMTKKVQTVEMLLSLEHAAEMYLNEMFRAHFLGDTATSGAELVLFKGGDTTPETVFWEKIGRVIAVKTRERNVQSRLPAIRVELDGLMLTIGVRNYGVRLSFRLIEKQCISGLPPVLAPELAI